jgi:hypothetical protein
MEVENAPTTFFSSWVLGMEPWPCNANKISTTELHPQPKSTPLEHSLTMFSKEPVLMPIP